MPDGGISGTDGHPAEAIYIRYLIDRESGAGAEWDTLLDAYPEYAGELERLRNDADSLDDLVAPLTEAVRPRSARPCPDLEPGTVWAGRFEIVRLIDAGGLGVVYEAVSRVLRQRVALKLLKMSAADDEDLLAEARDAAQLDHPHIVRVIEYGVHEGHPWLAMTYCPGGDLRRRTELKNADPRRTDAVGIIEKISRAVHHFHVKTGRVHLDIKPGNILFDETGEPRLTDFGVTHPAGEPAPPGGTPGFMPKEQDEGIQPVGVAADVYGLGSTLYWALTGAKQTGDLEPASRLNARVDRDLDAILATALRPDPEERYSSADVLANELGRWRRHEPIVIRTRGAGWAPAYHRADRLRLWRRRHPIVAPLVATVIALAAAGSAGIGWNWWQLTRARAELELTQYVERVELAGRELAVNNVPRARALLESCPPRWRGWEWRARRAECEADPLDLRVGSPSLGVTISREAARVAAVGLDGSVHCWDASTGRPAWSRSPYRGPARAAAFSPDGSLIAVAGGNFDGTRDAAVRILEASTGRERSVFRIEGLNPWSVAWSPDGRTVAYAGGGKSFGKAGALGLIDPDTGELRRSLPGHAGRVWSVAFSGTRAGLLASAGDDGTVRIWRAADGTGVTVFRSSGDPAFSVAFAPDDRTIAAGGGRHNLGDSGWLRDWNLASGSVRRFDGHTDEVWSVAFHPDGHRLASASKDRTVKVWDLASAREALTLYDHLDHARGVAWAGDTLVSTGEDGRVRVRGGADRPATGTRLPGHPARVWKAAFSRDGRHLVAGAQDGVVVVWDVRRRTVSRRLAGHAGPVRDVAFSPDGRWLASASYDDTVHLRTWPDGATRFVLADAGAGWVHAVAFRPDGARLAAASNYGFTLWRTGDGRRVPSPQGHHWIVSAAAWTPDGRLLVTAGWDQIVLLHREVGTTPVALRGHQGRIQDLAISPDGRRLATAGNDGMIRIWDLPTGRRRLAIRDHTGAVLDVTWSRDGRRLVSAGRDQTVRLWEAESGEELARWRGHPGLVRAVALSPVEPLLAVVSGGDVSGGITLWPLPEARSTPRTP